ncbi:universal stress protein UspA [Enterococcus sp. JM4C]|uniref:universal stress protein n=1 Tax=Candidatus Enterococcus huntleyi TaxID=1857217 RepID=UPI00137B36E0|nr:universal stress protein [Enterococcus sp. JM4C]KAF1297343.1 universal stress protein UspA [Enterococcus sp. JM4C]
MTSRYKNILVAVDGSKNAEKAFLEAIELSKEHEAHLYIAYVVNEVEVTHSAYAYSKLLAEEQAHVEKVLLEKVKHAKEVGLREVTPLTQIGNVKRVLTKTIPEQYPIDLLIVGATGKGAIQRVTVGSTAAYVVNQAPCNVLVVK